MHRRDRFIFEHPSNEQSIQKLTVQQSVFRTEGPTCRWHFFLSGRSGFVRQPTSWLTNHPDRAEALEKWCESVSGGEPDKHVQVKKYLASARYPVELVEYCPRVVREGLRGNEELSDVAAHKIAWQRTLEMERVKQAPQEEVKWYRGVGIWESVLRKDMDAEGAKEVSLRWIDTDKGDAGRERSRRP